MSTASSQTTFNAVPIDIQTSVELTRQSKLDTLYIYGPETSIGYPGTTSDEHCFVGHMVPNDPSNWRNILSEIQYSLGNPRGQRSRVYVGPLVDRNGQKVPCQRKFATCQGIKMCPFFNQDLETFVHTEATPEAMAQHQKLLHPKTELTPAEDVYFHTVALWSTSTSYGCIAQLDGVVHLGPVAQIYSHLRQTPKATTRGPAPKPTCQGAIRLLQFGENLILRCEHYNVQSSKNHLNFAVSAALYDVTYLQALFRNDTVLLRALEGDMLAKGYGPLAPCVTVQNCTSVKANCEINHRSVDGSMTIVELQRLPCSSSITIYEPLPEHRAACPNVLIVCSKPHAHPIPIPARTPNSISEKLVKFLENLSDLPNLTSRRLLVNEATKHFLQKELPHLTEPSFQDIHPSLGNLDHLQVYIDRACDSVYPHGTGWSGVLHMKQRQDSVRPSSQHYIRYAQELKLERIPGNAEDVQLLGEVTDPHVFRLIICIKSENSFRLVNEARHVQSDISFKRVAGWLEFELGGFDRINMCEAHRVMLVEIDRIVFEDTGKHIQYRHLHALDKDDVNFTGILSWSVDQHRGQAKGIGEYLREMSPLHKFDLYEPTRLLSELSPYEHLERILRLCFAHFTRNIQKTAVSQEVKDAMFSLHGVIHKDGTEAAWQTTLAFIRDKGNKAGRDWLQDKIDSKFALAALCWQLKERIPFTIWLASDDTTNVIESLHQDQLREGSGLTLLGGLLRGEQYDNMRYRLLQENGIRTRYQPSTPSAQVHRALSRQVNSKKRQYDLADSKIHELNNKFRKIRDNLEEGREQLQEAERKVASGTWATERLDKARLQFTKLEAQYVKIELECRRLRAAVKIMYTV
ncbi:hypothetical protein F5879DRAFT_992705 [Lentinula edodes]|nr:hypothetical protein F5879DRAFT_992705 [Lentinula edodes]